MSDKRKLSNPWLYSYMDYCKYQESPYRFHLWSGLFALSSCIGRNLYLDRGYYTLYPNLYILLLAGSASCRKTTSAEIAVNEFITPIKHQNIVSQKITDIALIQAIRLAGLDNLNSEIIIFNDELSTLLDNRNAEEIISILTALYNCKSHWEYTTIKRSKETMHNICANFLACTTPVDMQRCITNKHAQAGFMGRLIIVYEMQGIKKELFHFFNKEEIDLKDKLIKDLTTISELRGEFKVTSDGLEWINDWYSKLDLKDIPVNSEGYMGRKHDYVFKLAMLLSVSNSNSLVIEKGDLEGALEILNQNEGYLPEVLGIIDETDIGILQKRVLRIIQKYNRIKHSDLMRLVVSYLDATSLAKVIETLVSGNWITIDYVGEKPAKYYNAMQI